MTFDYSEAFRGSIGLPNTNNVSGSEMRYRDAFNQTLRNELSRDPSVFIMGEDIAGGAGRFEKDGEVSYEAKKGYKPLDAWGGPFAATKGLIQDFGPERIKDTPISEAGVLGAAIGAALTGTRPVVDLMYFDFVTVAFDQLLSNAAKSRYMFGGQTKVPLTMFARSGAGTGHAAQHSESFYSMLVHIPGLKVVVPSDPYSVKGLLAASIRDDDPVFLVNDKKLINLSGFVPDDDFVLELGKGRYLRQGSDVTLIGMSYTSEVCRKSAETLEKSGINCEVVDLLSLSPLDEDIILESVSKTNKVVIVDEDTPMCSMASEISSIIADKGFDFLDAPIKKVNSPHTPVPYNRDLEFLFMPSEKRVIEAVKEIVNY